MLNSITASDGPLALQVGRPRTTGREGGQKLVGGQDWNPILPQRGRHLQARHNPRSRVPLDRGMHPWDLSAAEGLWWCPCGCPWVTPLGRLSWPARGQCQWPLHVRSLTPVSRHHRAACPRAHSLSPFSPPWWTLLGVRHNNTPRPAPPRLLGASSRQHQTVPHRDSPVLHEALGIPRVGTSIQNRPETRQAEILSPTTTALLHSMHAPVDIQGHAYVLPLSPPPHTPPGPSAAGNWESHHL